MEQQESFHWSGPVWPSGYECGCIFACFCSPTGFSWSSSCLYYMCHSCLNGLFSPMRFCGAWVFIHPTALCEDGIWWICQILNMHYMYWQYWQFGIQCDACDDCDASNTSCTVYIVYTVSKLEAMWSIWLANLAMFLHVPAPGLCPASNCALARACELALALKSGCANCFARLRISHLRSFGFGGFTLFHGFFCLISLETFAVKWSRSDIWSFQIFQCLKHDDHDKE